jgi:AGCS family alanine or glycine:cation symporter
MALMAITNLTAILLLSPVVTLIASDYLRQRKLAFRRYLIPPAIPILTAAGPGTWDDLPRQ